MIPEYPKFKPFELRDIKKHGSNICEFAPANLIIWKEFDKPKITSINQNTCILISPPNEDPFFLGPLGNNKLAETIETCLKHTGKISRATEGFVSQIDRSKYHIKCLRNQFDYIYETKSLAELKGRKLDGKRNHIKKFKEHFPDYEFIKLNKDNKKTALKLFEIWFEMKKHSRFFPKLAYISQKKALESAFNHFDELNFLGGAILIDNEIAAFTLASPLNSEMMDVHFMYGHPGIRGITQVVQWEASNKSFSRYKYLNLEQDLGIPGLRKAKLSYYPLRLEKKFEITLKQ